MELADVTIDLSAAYRLSEPDVPVEVREHAVNRAIAGAHITKAEAERMVAEATEVAVDAKPTTPRPNARPTRSGFARSGAADSSYASARWLKAADH